MEPIFYLTKVSFCMAVCYLPYYFIFRKYTFFTINRGYLLLSLILSLIVPAIHIQLSHPSPVINRVSISHLQLLSSGNVNNTNPVFKNVANKNAGPNWVLLYQFAYWTITASLGIKLVFTLFHLMLEAKNKGYKTDSIRYIYNTKGKNSSFFNLMFLDLSGLTNKEGQQIIAHEHLHYKLLHSLDNLFIEVFKVFFWFNPLTYLFAKELRQTHEFEVDQMMTTDGTQQEYGRLLLKLCIPKQEILMNEFSSGELRGRLQMIMKLRSVRAKQLNYLTAIVLFLLFSSIMAIEPVHAGIDRVIKNDIAKLKKIKGLKQHLLAELSVIKNSTAQGSKEDLPSVKKDQKVLQVVFAAEDSVVTDQKNNILKLYGTAALSVGETKIIADYIRYDRQTSTVYARGVYQYKDKGKLKLGHSEGKFVLDSLILNVRTRKVVLYK